MYIQPLQAIESPGCYHVGGDVTIHPSATIAPGALIRAESNCRIEIGSSACLGMGVVIHACEGNITIGSGASLGAAVLIVGHASVGANASIGSSTTIRNCTVDSGAIVPAASLLGELGNSEAEATGGTANGAGLLGDIHSTAVCRSGRKAAAPADGELTVGEPAEAIGVESNGVQQDKSPQVSSNETVGLTTDEELSSSDSLVDDSYPPPP